MDFICVPLHAFLGKWIEFSSFIKSRHHHFANTKDSDANEIVVCLGRSLETRTSRWNSLDLSAYPPLVHFQARLKREEPSDQCLRPLLIAAQSESLGLRTQVQYIMSKQKLTKGSHLSLINIFERVVLHYVNTNTCQQITKEVLHSDPVR
jgi:hypothetical protein